MTIRIPYTVRLAAEKISELRADGTLKLGLSMGPHDFYKEIEVSTIGRDALLPEGSVPTRWRSTQEVSFIAENGEKITAKLAGIEHAVDDPEKCVWVITEIQHTDPQGKTQSQKLADAPEDALAAPRR
jgi:hypothetical protein